jgi:hypothetical protein
MPANYAQNRTLTLQDLFDQSGGQPPLADTYQASQDQTPNGLSDEEMNLYRILTSKDSEKKPEKGKKQPGQYLGEAAMGVGDALSAWAAIMGGSPSARTDNLGEYMSYLERQKTATELSNQRLGENAARREFEGAKFLYGVKQRKEEAAAAAVAKTEDAAWKKTQVEQANADRDAARQQAKAMNDADNATKITIEKMGNEARARSDGLQAELHRMRSAGEADKDQHAEYAKARQFVVGKKAEYMQMLADGKATPEQIIAQWQDTLDASDLSGTYREAADAFFQDKIGTLLMQYAPQQGPAPQPYGATGAIPQGQIDANRQVARQGPKY